MDKHYLVYKITNKINGKIYIGKHETYNIDDGYMGSGKILGIAQSKHGIENFTKEILFDYDNWDDMQNKEKELVNEHFVKRTDTYNIIIGGGGGGENFGEQKGFITAKDKLGNTMRVSIEDPRYLSGELVHHLKGTITVRDKEGNILQVNENDPRYLSGELVGKNKNQITVKDEKGNIFNIDSNDPRYLSGELKYIHTGKVIVKDKDGNKFKVDKNDKRYLSGELVGITAGKVNVRDQEGNTFQISKEDPRYLSGELVHITKGTIYIHNKITEQNKRIIKKDLQKWLDKGWYKGMFKVQKENSSSPKN